jgi:hypothetical protein
MCEKEKRRRRRNDLARMKNRARRIARRNSSGGFVMYGLSGEVISREEWVESQAVRLANNLCICSCYMCCNSRHNPYNKGLRKLTFQERKLLFVETQA